VRDFVSDFVPIAPLWRSCTAAHALLTFGAIMSTSATRIHSPRVTWLEVGDRSYYLIARCECCGLVVERQLDDVDDDAIILEAIGSELLSANGCDHVESAMGSGMRPALRR
jgi:hypothetical protein